VSQGPLRHADGDRIFLPEPKIAAHIVLKLCKAAFVISHFLPVDPDLCRVVHALEAQPDASISPDVGNGELSSVIPDGVIGLPPGGRGELLHLPIGGNGNRLPSAVVEIAW